MKIINLKINFQDSQTALISGIIGGALLIINSIFFRKSIVFLNTETYLIVIVISYLFLFCLYTIKTRKITLFLFSFYYFFYSIFVFSLIYLILNSSIYFLKSKTPSIYKTELKDKTEAGLRRSALVVFYFNEVYCVIKVPKNKYNSNAKKISIKYYNSILNSKVIDDYALF